MLSSDIGENDVHPLTLDTLEQAFSPIKFTYTEDISPLRTIVDGEASGEIVGGNLSLLTSGIGTAFEIDTKGELLLIEEVDEDISVLTACSTSSKWQGSSRVQQAYCSQISKTVKRVNAQKH
jgi:muramoyltetrapeptide carboxypeptidase LdcA involved in peptidoglycan recycling